MKKRVGNHTKHYEILGKIMPVTGKHDPGILWGGGEVFNKIREKQQ